MRVWPKKKPVIELSTTQSKGSGKGLDNVWAAIRRLKSQLDADNAKLNATMTAVSRVERKVYRQIEAAPSVEEKTPVATLPDGLFE